MILESIELKNIRSYNDHKIEFPKGITLFEGDQGSGKSSILMAIEFALFGTGSQKGKALLSAKAKEGSVILCFQADGISYEAKRGLKRTSKGAANQDPKNCHLKVNDEIQPFAPGELKEEILKILKFNEPAAPNAQSRIYRYAVYTPQTEMSQILHDSDKRFETVRRAFGVEDYKNARDNAERINRSINTKLRVLEDRLRDSGQNEIQTEHWREKKKKLGTHLTVIKKEEIELKDKLEIIKNEKEEITGKNSKKVEAENQKQQFHTKLAAEERSKKLYENNRTEIKEQIKEKKEITDQGKIKIPTELTEKEIDEKIKMVEKLNDCKINDESKKKSFEENISELQTII